MSTTVYENSLPLGTLLNEYRLEAVLGVGGFGMTYLARDTHLDKPVAIKEYLPGDLAVRALDGSVVPVSTDHRCDYQWGLDRFIQEARTLARFSHPHIVRVNRYFEANGTGYMVMDYEEGESLNQRLKRAAFPPETELRAIVMPLLEGLAAVHAGEFLHRDIKPSNIFLRASGSPVLLDFGAARAAGSGTKSLTAVLTPGYAPLEQYSADGDQGPWSDIYAMAGVLFRAVTDRNPPDAVARLQSDAVPALLAAQRARYGEPLLKAIQWGMSIKAGDRPRSVQQWQTALTGSAGGATAAPSVGLSATAVREGMPQATAPTTRHLSRAQARAAAEAEVAGRWRSVFFGALLVIALLIGGYWHRSRPQPVSESSVPALNVSRPPSSATTGERETRPATREDGAADQGATAVDSSVSNATVPAPAADPAGSGGARAVSLPPPVQDRVRSDFRSADRDGDGFLSSAEVAGRFPVIERDFAAVDRDGDRRISEDEFFALRERQFGGRKPIPRPPSR